MENLISFNQGLSSREIAELTGKQHAHVMRDIRVLLEQGVQESNFGFSFTIRRLPNGGSKKDEFYNLTPKGCLILASGYDALLREKIINRLEELETGRKRKAALPAQPALFPFPEDRSGGGIVFLYQGRYVVSSRTLSRLTGRKHILVRRSVQKMFKHSPCPDQMFIRRQRMMYVGRGQVRRNTVEYYITLEGFHLLRDCCYFMNDDVVNAVSAAFRLGPVDVPGTREPSVSCGPACMMERFVKAMAVMMGVDVNDISNLTDGGIK